MTEFDKFKEAVQEIKLDDLQKQKILAACKNKKRRKINYTALAAVAAMLVITVAVFSPGFLMKAGAPMEKADNYFAEEDMIAAGDSDNLFSDSSAHLSDSIASGIENGNYKVVDEFTQVVFDAEGFRRIYSVIPQCFAALVDSDEFVSWSSSVEADGGMAIVQFVEHFEISKEAFDEANRNYAKQINAFYGVSPFYFTPFEEHESYEIFNVETIYSFDKEEIDEYYTAVPKRESGAGSMPAEVIVPEEYYK